MKQLPCINQYELGKRLKFYNKIRYMSWLNHSCDHVSYPFSHQTKMVKLKGNLYL